MSKYKPSDHVPSERIRNFSIIAHIDHGKSTLADRLLELTQTVSDRQAREQYMDKLDLERERGITIKSQTARLRYVAKDGLEYHLNLIDTPGHVDFNYEVSRSLKACEGALLVVDASQGVEAQTLANVYLALEEDLELLVLLNKIDLPAADVPKIKQEIEETIGLDTEGALPISAKDGKGVDAVLEAIVRELPAPKKADAEMSPRALVFDSWYDAYRGVITMVRVMEGCLKKGSKIRFMATEADYEVLELGVMQPEMTPIQELYPGEVGYIVSGIKDIRLVRVGDTVTDAKHPAKEALPGFQPAQQMVFSSIYPTNNGEFENLREALEKLALNDASISFEPETSGALGFGFRMGFLGLLHMEIVQERLEREFDMDLVTTAPNVRYKILTSSGEELDIDSPRDLPDPSHIDKFMEPFVNAVLHTPEEYLGGLIKLCEEKRGRQKGLEYTSLGRVMLTYELPLAEVIMDFFDRLKTISKGYASLDYQVTGFQESQLVKVDVLLNGEPVDALSVILHRSQAERKGRALCEKLKEIIPRHQFEVPIQAAIGGRIIARETVRSVGKNVTAKCYGGDISRKRKLLEKQKEGKKRMKQFGRVELPQDAFMAILKVDS